MKNLSDILLEKLVVNTKSEAENIDPEDPTKWIVGDVLVTTGGYSMLLVHFYKITKATGKSFKVRELKQKIVSGNGMQGKCVAIRNEFIDDKEIQCRIVTRGSKAHVKIDDHYAKLWDGEPEYFDHLD